MVPTLNNLVDWPFWILSKHFFACLVLKFKIRVWFWVSIEHFEWKFFENAAWCIWALFPIQRWWKLKLNRWDSIIIILWLSKVWYAITQLIKHLFIFILVWFFAPTLLCEEIIFVWSTHRISTRILIFEMYRELITLNTLIRVSFRFELVSSSKNGRPGHFVPIFRYLLFYLSAIWRL